MTRIRVEHPVRSRSVARTPGALGKTFIAAVFLCASSVIAPLLGVAQSANAASVGMPACATPNVSEGLSTSQKNYGSGMMVVIKSSLRNTSNETCSVAVGPTSPSLIITNAKGTVVWNNCYANDQSAACALYLVQQTLKPGASYVKSVSWDQRSGQPLARVPTGSYLLSAYFAGAVGHHSTRIQISTSVSPQETTVTQADSGRSYSLRVGSRLFIELTGPAMYTWSEPVATNGTVLERSAGSSGSAAVRGHEKVSTGGQLRSPLVATKSPHWWPGKVPTLH